MLKRGSTQLTYYSNSRHVLCLHGQMTGHVICRHTFNLDSICREANFIPSQSPTMRKVAHDQNFSLLLTSLCQKKLTKNLSADFVWTKKILLSAKKKHSRPLSAQQQQPLIQQQPAIIQQQPATQQQPPIIQQQPAAQQQPAFIQRQPATQWNPALIQQQPATQ